MFHLRLRLYCPWSFRSCLIEVWFRCSLQVQAALLSKVRDARMRAIQRLRYMGLEAAAATRETSSASSASSSKLPKTFTTNDLRTIQEKICKQLFRVHLPLSSLCDSSRRCCSSVTDADLSVEEQRTLEQLRAKLEAPIAQ